MRMKADNEEILSRYRLQFHMMHFLIRLSAGSAIMEKYCGRNRMCKRKKRQRKIDWKEGSDGKKGGKRSEGNNGKANKRNKVQEKK